jgi:hypothetical protein
MSYSLLLSLTDQNLNCRKNSNADNEEIATQITQI